MKKIYNLCNNYNLGKLINEPTVVTGGLMHKMYHVSTDQGEYAIKVLNPDIMKRPEALANMINSEKVSNSLLNIIPLVAAKTFNGKNILEFDKILTDEADIAMHVFSNKHRRRCKYDYQRYQGTSNKKPS